MPPLKILYLDDEPELCEIFSDEFNTQETQVMTFVDPKKAIEYVKSNPPDLVFVDYRLPGTNGDQVAQAMPLAIPKYLITGESNVTTVYAFISVLAKPFNMEEIRHAIKAAPHTRK